MVEKAVSDHPDGMRVFISVMFSFFISSLLLLYYHDIFWYAPDEGVFAHMADRINAGQVYGVDFNGLQPGYHALFNAFLFENIGRDLVVMRYPIIVMGCIQAMLVTYMLRSYGIMISVFAGIWITVFGFLQFLNPSPNWYCSFFAMVVIFLLTEFPRKSLSYLLVGLCVGLSTGFRHPSGVFLALGVLGFVLYDLREEGARLLRDVLISKILLGAVLFALGFYCLFINHDYSSFFYIGVWPMIFAALLFLRNGAANTALLRPIGLLTLGGVIGIAPLFAYQFFHGDVSVWFNTSILGVLQQLELPHYSEVAYFHYPMKSWQVFLSVGGLFSLLFSLYWTVLYISVPALLFYLVRGMYKSKEMKEVSALGVVTAFYAYIMLYYQIPIYFYYTFGLFGLYALTVLRAGLPRVFGMACMAFLMVFNLLYFVAMPYEDASALVVKSDDLPGVSLEIPENSVVKYRAILDLIDEKTEPDDPIFVFPTNAEIYYLSQRPNPTPFTVTSNAVYDEESYAALLSMLGEAQPKLVFTREADKYFYIYEQRLLDDLIEKLGYTRAEPIKDFTILLAPH